MLFPPADRVIYEKNPLVLVICQLRFSLELSIDVAMPAEFQQLIRTHFPIAREVVDGTDLSVPEDVSEHFPTELLNLLSTRINRRFEFRSRDNMWTVSLGNGFVALETRRYIKWEDFRHNLDLVVASLCKAYQINTFTRIGLRYQNVVDRQALDLEDQPWSSLLSAFVLGPLAARASVENVHEHSGSYLIQLENPQEVVRAKYGLVTEKSGDPANVMFLLDHDFFTKDSVETEFNDVSKRVDVFNSFNRSLFRRCLTPKLHNAMVPKPTDH